MSVVREQGLDPVDIPDVVGMSENYIQGPVLNTRSTIQRFTRLRIALIGQLPVAVNDMITAPLKFAGDRRLASAGNAFDQIIPDAHFSSDKPKSLKSQALWVMAQDPNRFSKGRLKA